MGRVGVVDLLLPTLLNGMAVWSCQPTRLSLDGYRMFAPLFGWP